MDVCANEVLGVFLEYVVDLVQQVVSLRSQFVATLLAGGVLEQADGTAWMAFFSQNMLELAIALSESDPAYEGFIGRLLSGGALACDLTANFRSVPRALQ